MVFAFTEVKSADLFNYTNKTENKFHPAFPKL